MLLKYLMFELYMHLKSHIHKRRREGNKDEEKYEKHNDRNASVD